jgi:hypothetical protein
MFGGGKEMLCYSSIFIGKLFYYVTMSLVFMVVSFLEITQSKNKSFYEDCNPMTMLKIMIFFLLLVTF